LIETKTAPHHDSASHSEGSGSHVDQNGPQEQHIATATPTQIHKEAGSDAGSARAEHHGAAPARNDKNNMEDFATVLENFEAEQKEVQQQATEERVVKGTVVKITDKHVVVDFGSKSEGFVPLEQVKDHDGNIKVAAGDEIEVMPDGMEEGMVKLSYEKAQRLKAWDDIQKAHDDKKPIKAIVIERVKGGLSVDLGGARAFLPGSQVDLKPMRNLDNMKGTELEVRVVKLNKKRGNIVVSRKEILDEQQAELRTKTLEHLQEGSIMHGTVKNLTDYGAFVDLGGLDGLLHITDMSWGRLTHPRDLVHVGDEIQVKVLKYDNEKQRVSLGFKQLTPDPWLDAVDRYPVGAHVKGRIISTTDYGAFVELEQGIEGLVHVSEMTWSKRMKHPSKIVNVGDQVETVVLNVNPTERRISLGMKQLATNPWEQLQDKYPVGTTVEGKVRNLTEFGAFVEIEDGIDGLVHVSNMSWTKRVKHPSEVMKKGDKIKAVILAIEPEHRRLSLGVKQLEPDAWETFFNTHKVGDVVHGKVLRSAAFGSFVEIAAGVEALCHNSEAVNDEGAEVKLEEGSEHEFKIIKMNQDDKKVGLSLRGIGEQASKREVEAYKPPVSSSTTTLGDLLNLKRASNDQN
jgi:small subunit ribosomal protein S1